MCTDSEDVNVTNFVDIVARIPKHLDLYFYDFSTNFYTFSKFTDFDSIVHVTFPFYPLELLVLLTRGPWTN